MKRLILFLLAIFLLFSHPQYLNATTIPITPALQLKYRIKLGDVSFYARAGHFTDAFMRFSPNGKLLAIGTFLGKIILVNAKTGAILWEHRVYEGMVKKIDFSPDSQTIYYGEQSPDGFIYAANAETGHIKWRFSMTKDLKLGIPAPKGDIYGIYREPGCYRLKVLKNGNILVLGIHSWPDHKLGYWRRLSMIWLLSPDGHVIWKWPKRKPIELSLYYADADPNGNYVATVAILPSDKLPANYPYTPGTVYVLNGKTGKEIAHYKMKPLKPYYNSVSIWESVAVDPLDKFVVVGTSDGRGFIFDLKTLKPIKILHLATPIIIGGIPVAATATYVEVDSKRTIFFQTSSSSIPYGLPVQANQPAGPHPNAQTIFAVSPNGKILWRFHAPFKFQGFASDISSRILATVAGAASRMVSERRTKQFGIFVFNLEKKGGGLEKLLGYFPTIAPLFFHLAVSPDAKLIAACETPYINEKGRLVGTYQVDVLAIKDLSKN